MENILNNIQLIISGATLIGIVIAVYKANNDPDIKAKESISVLKEACKIKHEGIDEDISEIREDVKLIKVNHLTHIERDMSDLKSDVKSVLAILKDRQTRG